MDRSWKAWGPRVVLLAAGLLYLVIGSKFVIQPDASAAESGYRLAEAVGRTNIRAGVGGFPLGVAAALLFCVVSPRRTLWGLRLAAGVTGVVLLVRLGSALSDGVASQAARLLAPEAVMTALTAAGAWLLARRRSDLAA
jgi:hypothetical protein